MENEHIIREKLRILQERRTIRKFRSDPIPKSLVLELIHYATLAPSATNRQGWRFILVNDPSLQQCLVDAGASVLINQAPCGVLVIYENTTRGLHYHDDYQSASACIQNLLLAAQAYGLGSCWICHLPPRSFLRKMFHIPPNYSPIAYIALGYPKAASIKEVPRKYALEDIVGENTFRETARKAKQPLVLIYLERILIWAYYKCPFVIRKHYLNKIIDQKFTKKFDN